MKRFLLTLALIATLLIPGGLTLASDISDALYYGTIRATNNSTAASDVSVNCSINSTALIASGTFNSTATNVAIRNSTGADTPFMPGYGNSPWMVWYDSVPANGNTDAVLYTNTVNGTPRYFPGTAGMSANETDLDNLSDNFTLEQSGWLNTTAGSNTDLAYKPGAFRTYVSGSGNITSTIYSDGVNSYVELVPNGAGDYANITNYVGSATHYLDVDDPVASPDNATTYVWEGGASLLKDAYNSTNSTPLGYNSEITSVTVFYRWSAVGSAGGDYVYLQPFLRLGTNETAGTLVSKYYTSIAWTTANETLARPGGGSWSWADIDALQVAIGLKRGSIGGDKACCTQVYIRVNYTGYPPIASVTATAVSSEEHTVQTSMDSPFLGIAVDTDVLLPVTDNLALNAPLPQAECNADPFTSIDDNEFSLNPSGATWTSAGYSFSGTNQYIDCGYDSDLRGSAQMSLEAWVKFTSIATTDKPIASQLNTAGDEYVLLRVRHTTGLLNALIYQSDHTAIGSNFAGAVVINTWYHLVLVADGSFFRLYKNGVADVTTFAYDGTLNTNNTHNDPFYIGKYSGLYLPGIVGEFRDYTRGLSAAEVLQNFNATKYRYLGTGTNYHTYSTTATVPDNANDWTFCENGAVPYMEYTKLWVGGVPKAYWQWQYDDEFTDLWNSHTATPTFRTTSSDADVSASLINFQPISLAEVDEDVISAWPSMMVDAPDEPPTAYTEEAHPGIFFEPLVHTIWGLSGLPDSLFWYNFAFFFIIAAGILTFWFFAKNNVSALLVKVIVMMAIMIFFALPGPNIYGLYVCLYFGFWCFGILVLSRSYGW